MFIEGYENEEKREFFLVNFEKFFNSEQQVPIDIFFEKYINKLNEILNTEDDSLKGNNVMLFSEAYEYLADDFGLEVKGVLDLDEEKDISAGELASTIDIIKSENVPLIIAEKEYGEKMANAVMKETDAKTIYLNTIIRGDYDKDAYINGMKSNIELLKGALK